jgi:alpha-tubulin suppressor-like RCC1 family protein
VRATRSRFVQLVSIGLALLGVARPGVAQSEIKGWGLRVFDSRWNDEHFVEISAGRSHTVARRSDGSVVAWGDNLQRLCIVPPLPPGLSYIQIAAGGLHTIALRSDGSAIAWGYPYGGKTQVPALPPGLTYVEVAAGLVHSIARRSDGSAVAWGDNQYGNATFRRSRRGSPTSRSRPASTTPSRAGATAP